MKTGAFHHFIKKKKKTYPMTKGLHISNLSLQSINLEFAQLTIVIVSIRSQKNKNKTIDGSVHGNSGIRVNNNKNEKTESNHEESTLMASTKFFTM